MVDKIEKTMHDFKHGELHSGSKEGPLVKSRKQAIAIGLSEARHAKTKALRHSKDASFEKAHKARTKKKWTSEERQQHMKEVHEKWYEQ